MGLESVSADFGRDRDDAAEALIAPAVELARQWSLAALAARGDHRRSTRRLGRLLTDEAGLDFVARYLDRVPRSESSRVAGAHIGKLVEQHGVPAFLGPVDRVSLRTGAVLADRLPWVVAPVARRRLRGLVGHLVVDADDRALRRHLRALSRAGVDVNLNLLGEAVLGEQEARTRRDRIIDLLRRDDVDYVSVKTTSVVSQLRTWDHAGSVQRVLDRLRPLLRAATSARPAVFVNLDVEEYRDLALTVDVFRRLLDEDEFLGTSAGIAVQAYLPDSVSTVAALLDWATRRGARGGAEIRIRLVKGANLSMEWVDAVQHGWEPATYGRKSETDANYKRLLDMALRRDRLASVRIGLASHNLFDVAWGSLLAETRGVADRVDVEMLHGMAPGSVREVSRRAGRVRLYTPVVARADFDVAIAYLMRRLEEITMPGNFLRSWQQVGSDPGIFEREARAFHDAVRDRHLQASEPRRRQDRRLEPRRGVRVFTNEPDTDPALAANRRWARMLTTQPPRPAHTPVVRDTAVVDLVVARARIAAATWRRTPAADRRSLLYAIADELALRRGELITTMMTEAGKPIDEADPEVSEAIDFARYYGDRALELTVPGARFAPLGVVAVVPPWNFPVAIPAGGMLAALAAGNAVVLKPAPETPRCAEVVMEAFRSAGADPDLTSLLRLPDDHVGRHLITHPGVDGVVLTGALATAQRFRSWRPELRLFGETSGKNAMVITSAADVDLAVADLVRSAFGHAGQKCSAASLAILVGEVATSRRFRRQLVDAVSSLTVGAATDLATRIGPLVRNPEGPLRRALTCLDAGERWLIEPRRLDDTGTLWSPGIKEGVRPGSYFHLTECFGPVLGLMTAADLRGALELLHAPGYGLTGGIHSLDDGEVAYFAEQAQVGNVYVNRHITGAIVQRQPFGGWNRSGVGPGAKTGGPNYVSALGSWTDAGVSPVGEEGRPPSGPARDLLRELSGHVTDEEMQWLEWAATSDEKWWQDHVSREHDPTGLPIESNVFRYRPYTQLVIRVGVDTPRRQVARAMLAALRTGAPVRLSSPVPVTLGATRAVVESETEMTSRLADVPGACLRLLADAGRDLVLAAEDMGVRVIADPVVCSGRIELLRYVREQTISATRHRYGRVVRGPVRRDAGMS